ncbi:hypothetical protein SH661x_004738 [Planctomicrobium sp. SH661]|uniref:hypothetical protein n=1 Tax=Planctomicrobium sp. SH661 TaxID=3448124 RepID=UPI003F5AFC72
MASFSDLIASRRAWIETVLEPWCRTASRRDLLLAEQEWQDIAGRPAPQMTLWLWAWSRFPDLCDAGLTTLNETLPVRVECHDGRSATGYPDARKSERGQLVLIGERGETFGPFSIDDLSSVHRVTD